MGLLSSIGAIAGLGGNNPSKLPLINIDPSKVQQNTLTGNIAAAPKAFELADLANTFSADQLNKQLEKMIPGYAGLRNQATGVIGSELRGEIPKDVERLLQQRAAEKGVTLGTSGSGFESNDLLRNLGLTSLQLTQQGLDSASKWIASVPKAPTFDFTQMFYTPQQRLSFGLQQATANLPIRSFNNWQNSLPSNLDRGISGLLSWADTGVNAGIGYAAGGGFSGGSSPLKGGGSNASAGDASFGGLN